MANFKLEDDDSIQPAPGAGTPPPTPPAPTPAKPAPATNAAPPNTSAPSAAPRGPASARPAGAAPAANATPRPQGAPQQGQPPKPGQRPAAPHSGVSPEVSEAIAQAQNARAQSQQGKGPKRGPAPAPAAAQGQPPYVQAAQPQGPQPIRAVPKRSKVLATASPTFHRTLDALEPYATWLFRASFVVGLLALAVLMFALLGGGIGSLKAGDAANAHIASDLIAAAKVVNAALICLAITGIILAFDEKSAGPITAITGLCVFFAFPLIVSQVLGAKATNTGLHAAHDAMQALHPSAITLITLGLLKYSVDVAIWLSGLPDRMKLRAEVGVGKQADPAQVRAARDANMFSPCWKLPFCREVIRKQCPAYLAKKRCWKFGRGCYCDEEMISRIIRGENQSAISAPTRMSREGKAPCGRCYIFLEHQSHKYRALSPLALPGTIGIMFAIWPIYSKYFFEFNKHLSEFWDRLSFTPSNMATGSMATDKANYDVGNLDSTQIANIAVWIFGILLGFFMLIYISKFIEWAIYKAKL